MQCRECRRLKDSDGRVGWCTARGMYRYLIEETMGCPYFEEKETSMTNEEYKQIIVKSIDQQQRESGIVPAGPEEPHPDTKRLMELLYVVEQKVPGESRFDTALRMLKERQEQTSRGCDANGGGDGGLHPIPNIEDQMIRPPHPKNTGEKDTDK